MSSKFTLDKAIIDTNLPFKIKNISKFVYVLANIGKICYYIKVVYAKIL